MQQWKAVVKRKKNSLVLCLCVCLHVQCEHFRTIYIHNKSISVSYAFCKSIHWGYVAVYGRWRHLDRVSETGEWFSSEPETLASHASVSFLVKDESELVIWVCVCLFQGSSLDSMDIERQYQSNPQGQVNFTAGRYGYILYFNGKSGK